MADGFLAGRLGADGVQGMESSMRRRLWLPPILFLAILQLAQESIGFAHFMLHAHPHELLSSA